jgi:ABC-type transport system involved in Fe-S cluster assembly fused permease/ATPase subunit
MTEKIDKYKGLKLLFKYLLKFKVKTAISIGLLVVAKLVSVADPYILKLLIDLLVEGGSEVAFGTLAGLIVLFFIIKGSTELIEGLRIWIFAPVETNIKRLVALDVFDHLMNLPLSFHINRSTGGVSRKITRGSTGLEQFLFLFTGNVLPTFVELIFITIIFTTLFPFTFTITLLIFVTSFVSYTVFAVNRRQKILLATNKLDDDASGKSIDALLNFDTVKYFANEKFEHTRYGDSLKKWVISDIKSSKMEAYIYRGQGIVGAIGLTTLLSLSVHQYMLGTMTVGDLIMVTTYLSRISIPLSFLGFIYRHMKESMANMDEMFRLLDVKNTILDKKDALPMPKAKGEVEFENVNFQYNEDRQILTNISFKVPANTKVALVGYSGSGKSTISKLLFRLYDVTGGSIKIDGQDLRDVDQTTLRKNLGIVAQDTPLFNDTIYQNIAYGKPGSTREEIERVAKIANIHDFIMELPEKYETIAGERGVKLSGGEKQRVAIARMLLKDPPILIFDEATASLDSKAEKIIQNAIEEISKEGRTTIVIAHRLSTIADFDEIIVMKKGEIVEQGNHKDLLDKKGVYANLWSIQKNEHKNEEIKR